MYCVLYLVLSQKYLMDLLWYHTNAGNFVGKSSVFCLKNPQSICWKLRSTILRKSCPMEISGYQPVMVEVLIGTCILLRAQ